MANKSETPEKSSQGSAQAPKKDGAQTAHGEKQKPEGVKYSWGPELSTASTTDTRSSNRTASTATADAAEEYSQQYSTDPTGFTIGDL
jgi:hypothetical protein